MIDIIVPTYNRAKMLALTLSSIVNQTFDLRLVNVIVVDDGSNDDTAMVAEKYSRSLNLKYFYQEDKGYRVASARNIGLQNSNSDIFLLIDAGILLESHCVETHVNFHGQFKHPVSAIGYVYGFDKQESDLRELQAIFDKMKNIDDIVDYLDRHKMFLDIREDEYSRHRHQIHNLPAPWVYFWSGHVSVNRKSLAGQDIFDTLFEPRYGYEDIDLGYRLHKQGTRIFLLTEAKAFHYPHKKVNNYDSDLKINSQIFNHKHNTDVVRLFTDHGGTFGFNELLLSKNIKVPISTLANEPA